MTAAGVASPRALVVWFRDLHRWSVGSFVQTDWRWPADTIRPLSAVLSRKVVDADPASGQPATSQLVTLHFDGEMEPREANAGDGFKGRLFYADPGDVIYSRIDVRNGAIGIIPDALGRVCVSSEYPVYTVNPQLADARFVKLLFRTAAFRRKINSMISGASGRKRVQPADLEAMQVPLPPLAAQRKIVTAWETVRRNLDDALNGLRQIIDELDGELRPRARMDALSCPYLIAQWKNLDSLDMKAARAALFRFQNPTFRPLGDFVEEATELVKPWEQPDTDWPVYGVNNKEGVIFSHSQKGKDFNAPYKRITEDWFFHNPTRSSVGSLGIVPAVPADAITSPEYQVWRVTRGLLPGYVAVLIRTPFFIDLVQVHRVGAVKQRLYVENLLQIPIPMIPEVMQQRFARARETAIERIADAKARTDAAKADVEAMILGSKPV